MLGGWCWPFDVVGGTGVVLCVPVLRAVLISSSSSVVSVTIGRVSKVMLIGSTHWTNLLGASA